MKAVILARVSSTEQEYGKSLEAQIVLGKQYAQHKGLEIIREYRLVESSTRGTRKKFHQMLAFVKAQHDPIAIIMHTVDRLQRRCDETVMLTPLIDKGRIELHFVASNLVIRQSSSISELMMWRMNVLGAETYIMQLRENTRRGINKKIEDGEWPSKAPIGYLNYTDGKYSKIKVDEERAPFVKKAFTLYSTGIYSAEEIWRRLRNEGFTNTKGSPIDRNVVHKMLQNPFYYGEMSIKGQLIPHIYPPLIDRDLFERCEAIRAGFHKTPFKYGGKQFIFKGLLHCGYCGNSVSSYTKVKPSGKQYTYLRCSKYGHKDTCKAIQVQESVALEQVERALGALTITDEMATAIAQHLTNYNKGQVATQIKTVQQADREIARISAKIDRLIDLQLNSTLSEELFKQKLADLQAEQGRLKLLKEQNTIEESEFDVSFAEVLDLAKNAVAIFRSSKIDEKREILTCVLSPLELKGKNLYFLYKKPFDLLAKGSMYLKSRPVRDSNS